jgi:endonuclease YncB( thermonuclease family)
MLIQDKLWTYKATLLRVVDGDTFYARIDQGFSNYTDKEFRLLGSKQGVNCPELKDSDPAVKAKALAAKAKTEELLPVGTVFYIVSTKPGSNDPKDMYGRYLAQAILPDGRNLGDVLMALGLAVLYKR